MKDKKVFKVFEKNIFLFLNEDFLKVCFTQRHVGKTNLSIWRHSLEQVYLGKNHNKSQHRKGIACLSSSGDESKSEKGNLLFTAYPNVRIQFAYFSEKIVPCLHFCVQDEDPHVKKSLKKKREKTEYIVRVDLVNIYSYVSIYKFIVSYVHINIYIVLNLYKLTEISIQTLCFPIN